MPTQKEYSYSLKDFNSYAESVLSSTTDDECKAYLNRLKNFMESDEITNSIIKNIGRDKEPINVNDFLGDYPGEFALRVNAPIDIDVHMLSIYELINHICDQNLNLSMLGLRLKPGVKSNAVSDKIQHFTGKVFRPLFDYIERELEKGKISMEDNKQGMVLNQTINGNGNILAYSGRDTIISGEVLKESEDDLNSLIKKAMQELTGADITEDEKEEILDDLQTLSSEISSEKPREIKFKKVKKNIDTIISGADETLKKSAGLIGTLTLIGTKLTGLITQ